MKYNLITQDEIALSLAIAIVDGKLEMHDVAEDKELYSLIKMYVWNLEH